MDNSAQRELRWSPVPGLVAVAWLGLAAFGAVALAPNLVDARGRLLSALAGTALLVAAAIGTFARPRLAADTKGIQTRTVTGTRHYPWSWVQRVEVVRTRRLGREVPLLEIDITDPHGVERLLVFGRLDLGADPDEVGEQLNKLVGSPGG